MKSSEITNSSLDNKDIKISKEVKKQNSAYEKPDMDETLNSSDNLTEISDKEQADSILDNFFRESLLGSAEITPSPSKNLSPTSRPPDVQKNIDKSIQNIHDIADGNDKNPIAHKIQQWIQGLLN